MGKSWKTAGKVEKAQQKGQIFTKLAREIAVAAKAGGPDPGANARLRLAIDAAKKVSCPNDTIERAIKKGAGLLDDGKVIEDSLLDRILIVHRYLEGSGLDAGDTLIRRLEGTSAKGNIQTIVKQINFEEIGHVDFGSQWYRRICEMEKIDPNTDFAKRMDDLRVRLPKRIEPLNKVLRLKAGFTEQEIEYYESLRLDFLKPTCERMA